MATARVGKCPTHGLAPRLDALEGRALMARFELVAPGGLAMLGQADNQRDALIEGFNQVASGERRFVNVNATSGTNVVGSALAVSH